MSNLPILRPYQSKLLELVETGFSAHTHQIVQLATGAGKTHVFSHRILSRPDCNFAVIVHRAELLQQAYQKLKGTGIPSGEIGVIAAGTRTKALERQPRVTVAMVQSARKRTEVLESMAIDEIIVDECHHVVSNTWAALLAAWPNARVLGFSATPHRLDGKPFRAVGFSNLILARDAGASIEDLTAQGYLAYADYRHLPVGVSTAAKKSGVWTGEALVELFNIWHADYSERQSIVYLYRKAECHDFVKIAQSRGVSAAWIDDDTKAKDRAEILQKFKNKEVRLIANVQVLTEGFDDPDIGCVMLARRTESLVLYLQMVGRALRPYDGPPPVILDCVGAVETHRHYGVEHEWQLDGAPKDVKPKEALDIEPVVPPGDNQKNWSGKLQKIGIELPKGFPHPDHWTPDELAELGAIASRGQAYNIAMERSNACTRQAEFMLVAAMHGYKMGWAYRRMGERSIPFETRSKAKSEELWEGLCAAVSMREMDIRLRRAAETGQVSDRPIVEDDFTQPSLPF